MARKEIIRPCRNCGEPFFGNVTRTFCSQNCYRSSKIISIEDAFWKWVERGGPDECWPWIGAIGSGEYGEFRSNGKRTTAHRISWELHNGPIQPGLLACHSCDSRYPKGDKTYRRCCNPAHLFLGSHAENSADMVSKGRESHQHGETSGGAKLTDALVRYIRASPATNKDVAAEVGIARSRVSEIRSRKAWTHI